MLKYVDTKVTFSEVPNQIALCINISRCPIQCPGCHSAYLANDIGENLTPKVLSKLIDNNTGISTICFMGGDAEPLYINFLAAYIRVEYPSIRTAWYSGRDKIHRDIDLWNFDWIKVGPYKKECGPLNCKTTNQKFYKVVHLSNGVSRIYDITYNFWNYETEDKSKEIK